MPCLRNMRSVELTSATRNYETLSRSLVLRWKIVRRNPASGSTVHDPSGLRGRSQGWATTALLVSPCGNTMPAEIAKERERSIDRLMDGHWALLLLARHPPAAL